MPRDLQVGRVADAELVDAGEEVVRGVAREDVGESGLDSHPHECQPTRVTPLVGMGQLGVS